MKRRVVIRILAMVARWAPSIAFRLSDMIMSLVERRLSLEPKIAIFGLAEQRDAPQGTAHARKMSLRDQILRRMMMSAGMDALRRVVLANDRLETLRPPIILGTFHVGVFISLGSALERVPGRVLVLRRSNSRVAARSGLLVEPTDGDEQHRARVFYRALEWLRRGDTVFMALDPSEAVRIASPFRGRSLLLARGPFAMSRIMQVPIVPIVARWRGSRIEIIVGDPIPPASDESAIAAGAAAWLERYLLESPLEISERIRSLTT